MTDLATLNLLLPETMLIAAGTLIYLLGAFIPKHFRPNLAAGGAILVAAAAAIFQDARPLSLFHLPVHAWISGPIAADVFGHTARWAILLFGLLFVMASSYSPRVRPAAEYAGSLLFIIAGLMLIATAYDLVMMFLGLELVSIPTYVVLYLGKRDAAGQEATAKYFFLSILSSALLLYGFSFLYGLAGSTRLDHLAVALAAHAGTPMYAKLAPVALLLVFAGLGFRMTAVPFHFYAPDVYQGTNTPNAGLLSTLPKIAGLLALVRIVVASMPGQESLAWRSGARDFCVDHDAGQCNGFVAGQRAPTAGLLVDRARRLHADRRRRGVGLRGPTRRQRRCPSRLAASARRFSIWPSIASRPSGRSPRFSTWVRASGRSTASMN